MDLELKLARLRRVGGWLSLICRFAQIASIGTILYCAAMMVLLVLDIPINTLPLPASNTLSRFSYIPAVGAVPPREQALIALFAVSLTKFVLLRFLHFFWVLSKEIYSGETPFTSHNAVRLRRLAALLLALIVWSLPLALVLSAAVFLVSYIFDYGTALHTQAEQTIQVQEDVILSFAEMMEVKSGETGQHVKRVSEYSRILGLNLDLSREQAEVLRIASMMHDVGKILTPIEILEKPGKLTEEEFAVIKRHVTDGERMLHNASGKIMQAARMIALEHHERWDGKGYLGHTGEEIDLLARIVAVADVYDALTARRSYKEPWTPEKAKEEILHGVGTQFDPAVVKAFEQCHTQFLQVEKDYQDLEPFSLEK